MSPSRSRSPKVLCTPCSPFQGQSRKDGKGYSVVHVWWTNKSSHLQVHSFCPSFFLLLHFELCASIFQWAATPTVKCVNTCSHPCCFEWGLKDTEAMKHGSPAEKKEYVVWRVWEISTKQHLSWERKRGVEQSALLFCGLGAWAPLLPVLFRADLLKEARYLLMQTTVDRREAGKREMMPLLTGN